MDKQLDDILQNHKLWLAEAGGERANLCFADLRGANLRGANLSHANLRGADLSRADLSRADLRGADLSRADLSRADLNLADLSGADIDFSVWPLWCGTMGVKVDRRIAAQLAAHFCVLDCDDPDYLVARAAVLEFAKNSHRARELGLLED